MSVDIELVNKAAEKLIELGRQSTDKRVIKACENAIKTWEIHLQNWEAYKNLWIAFREKEDELDICQRKLWTASGKLGWATRRLNAIQKPGRDRK